MKKHIVVLMSILLSLLTANTIPCNGEEETKSWSPEVVAEMRAYESPIPLQAAVCDIVGIGIVTDLSTNYWGATAHIAVSNYWAGNPGTNTLGISANYFGLTVTNTPIVFFASSYALPRAPYISEYRFSLLFCMPRFSQGKQPREPWLYDNERSWFYATPENAEMVTFASNLVHVAQVTTNRQDYYELVRDGFRLSPPGSRIHIDSEVTFINCRYWMPTNFMMQIWSDSLLPDSLRDEVNNSYMLETGHWLP